MRSRLAAIALALLAACSDGLGTGPTSAVSGVWTYAGSQDSPTAAQLNGSVSWADVAADGTFEGTFSIVEAAPGAAQRTLTGTSAGQVVSDSIADFDISVTGAASRHHLGILRGDSISGMWAELGGTSASGRFVLHRSASSIR